MSDLVYITVCKSIALGFWLVFLVAWFLPLGICLYAHNLWILSSYLIVAPFLHTIYERIMEC